MANDEYTKVNINTGDSVLWTPEKANEELEGVFIDRKSHVGANRSNIYTVQTADGGFVAFWGSAVIDASFDKIPLGAQVKIVYLGKQKNTKGDREFKNYDIYSKQIKTSEANIEAPEEDVNPDEVPF